MQFLKLVREKLRILHVSDELLHRDGLRHLRTYLLQPSRPVHRAITTGC